MRILTIGAKPVLCEALASQQHVDLLALTKEPGPHPFDFLPYDQGGKLSWRSIRQVRTAIQQRQPDIVHAFYPRPLAHAVLASLSLGSRVPIVSYRGVTSVPVRWSPDQWITYLSRRVAAHACESQAVAESLVEAGIAGGRCHVVHNCLREVPAFRPRAEARSELGVVADRFVVMMVANMRRVKGADVLLKAVQQCADLEKLHVVLVGTIFDDEVSQLATHPAIAKRVSLAGFRRDASQLVAAADLFVMPSRAEALCMALLEAMSAGVCPIVSDAGGMKEAVRHGEDGLVFAREDHAALAKCIRQLYNDRPTAAIYAANSARRAAEHFSPAAMADRIVTMYQKVLDEPSAADQQRAA